ncbi:hypothetical protein ACYSNU_17415 [Enterococcus sp. LJL120]
MISVPEWMYKDSIRNGNIRCKKINQYFYLEFIKGEYQSDSGFQYIKSTKTEDIEDRMF